LDKHQVQEKIIEAAQVVKNQLIEQGVAAKGRVEGYKYIDDVRSNLRRLFLCFDLLDPHKGSSVFEIGPGNCYFLVMCRELRGCRVAGVDRKPALINGQGQLAFRLFREHFGLDDWIRAQTVEGSRPIDFAGSYDAIVATRAHFNQGWGKADYRYWLHDCYHHLLPGGKLMVHFHRIESEIIAAFPLLEPVYAIKAAKKLSVVSREAIGHVLGNQT
jgi:hypothetical protein